MNLVKDFNYYYSFFNPQAEKFGGIDLYQLSDQSCIHNKTISTHTQFCDELTVVYGGDGVTNVNGNDFQLSKGTIHLCFKGEKHSLYPTNENPIKFYCIGFTIPKSHPVYEEYNAIKRQIKQGSIPVAVDIYDIISHCKEAVTEIYFNNDTKVSKLLIGSIINEIIILAVKTFNKTGKKDYDKDILVHRNLIYDIITYLNDNINNKDALKDIAETLNYSYSHLSHLFSQTMNETLKEYFNRLKMTSAQRYLLEGKKVTDVSELLHYSTIHAFSRAYKNFFGKPPKEIEK